MLFLLLVISCLRTLNGDVIDLAKEQWSLRGHDDNGQELNVPATVPGNVYTDLQTAGIIQGDLYYRFNDVEFRWISYKNWSYEVVFDISSEQTKSGGGTVYLDCLGLDTVSSVYINDVMVGVSDNMFIRYRWNINTLVHIGSNKIRVEFQSPVEFAKQQADLHSSTRYPVPPSCVPEEYHGECHANHIRKMQSSFSWDWGPAFPGVGVWQPMRVVLGRANEHWVDTIKWTVEDVGDQWHVRVDIGAVYCDTLPANDRVTVEILGLSQPHNPEGNGPCGYFTDFTVDKSDVELWWPNGHGKQTMYTLKVVAMIEDTVVETERRVAFRKLELVQEPLSQGLSFYFKVNDKAIFMKGSNWIPAHVIPTLNNYDTYYDLLYSAKEAHMNMLRVWGGGIYELDEFYSIADELGILIWQDFMFACSMYPANDRTLTTVAEEVRQQVKRLQYHPSIALWAGNNENEAALRGNWYGTDGYYDEYKQDYVKLYVDTIKTIVNQEDPRRPFLVSSPGNGKASEEEGYIAEFPYDSKFGDTHFYNYRDNNWDWRIYPKTRFASEYGFQSWSSFEVMEPVSEIWDWSLSSAWMSHRQHHPGGNLELMWQINLNMELDMDSSLDNVVGLQEFIYLSQVYQAMALKVETETYRRQQVPADNVTGEGLTMGALYWQLNDIWQGASWSSLDHGGGWKLSHYYAEQFFRPTIVSPIINGDNVELWLICDQYSEDDIQLGYFTYKYSGHGSGWRLINPDKCDTVGAKKVADIPLLEILQYGNCTEGSYDGYRKEYCLIGFGFMNNSTSEYYTTSLPPTKTKLGWKRANVRVTSIEFENSLLEGPYLQEWSIGLETDNVALFVTLSSGECDGRFSENGFHLYPPGGAVKFYSKDYLKEEELRNCLSLMSYGNNLPSDRE